MNGNNKKPKFPSKEYFDLMFKESNKKDSLYNDTRSKEDPKKDIIRFLLNERNKFVENR